MFGYIFASFLAILLIVDRLFLPRSARRAWTVMAVCMAAAMVVALAPGVLEKIADFLGVGRAVDLVLYFTTAILLREVFLSRARSDRTLKALTRLTRAQAIDGARRVAQRQLPKGQGPQCGAPEGAPVPRS